MIIQHQQFVNLYQKDKTIFSRLFSNVSNITTLCNRIDAISVEYLKFGYTDEEGSAKLKGDLFEIFAEIYFRLNEGNNRVGITNYMPTIKDAVGVDATGIGVDGKPATVQIKFRSNPKDELLADDIGQFTSISFRKYKVDVNTINNMILFTSCVGMNWKTEKEVFCDSIRTINITKINHDTCNNNAFWIGLNSLIDETIIQRYKIFTNRKSTQEKIEYVKSKIGLLNNLPLLENSKCTVYENEKRKIVDNYSQKRCFDSMQINDKLCICTPTGTGKGYLLFIDMLNRVVNTDEKIFTLCSHRLVLNKQHMRDIFDLMEPLLGEVGYIFVGSEEYDITDYQDIEKTYNSTLKERGLIMSDIIKTVMNPVELRNQIELHKLHNRKIIIISTYHSLNKLENIPIDVMYCDEAHILATDSKDSNFKENYQLITAKKRYFFTATPKNFFGDTSDLFLNNNKEIFGEILGLDFIVAVDMGYIINGYYHIVEPTNYTHSNDIGDNTKDRITIVEKSFKEHIVDVRKYSVEPDKIGAKMLVKCRDIQTDMWVICNGDATKGIVGLIEVMKDSDVKIFAGGSIPMQGSHGIYTCYINGKYSSNRKDYLDALDNLKSEDKAIILHYDILSEGINISGFTGVMFLSGALSSESKVLQNIGRTTRLHPIDRERLLKGEITTKDKTKWVKPYCRIIIPYWDKESQETKTNLINLLIRLRNIGFEHEPAEIGSDMPFSNIENLEEEGQNDIDLPRRRARIEGLTHLLEEIELTQKYNALDEFPFEKFCEMNDVCI